MFTYNHTIKLHETDAAGVLFFANQFKYIHDAYEAFVSSVGFSFSEILLKKSYFVPIVHAESSFKKPLFVGDQILIHVKVDAIGDSSFTLAYDLRDKDNQSVGTAKTVHSAIDKKTKKKITLPEDARSALESVPA